MEGRGEPAKDRARGRARAKEWWELRGGADSPGLSAGPTVRLRIETLGAPGLDSETWDTIALEFEER